MVVVGVQVLVTEGSEEAENILLVLLCVKSAGLDIHLKVSFRSGGLVVPIARLGQDG